MKYHLLAIVAHCRDAFDMIGGTLANHVERGDQVTVGVISGENFSDAMRLKDMIAEGKVQSTAKTLAKESAMHRKRMCQALGYLGVKDIRFIPHKGVMIGRDDELVQRIANVVLETKPHLLITHHPNENGGIGDHPAAGWAATYGAWLAEINDPSRPTFHRTGQIYFMCPPGDTTQLDAQAVNRYPGIQIDITRQVKKKVKALASLETQYATMKGAAKEIEMLSGQAALHSRVSYMEAFINHRPEIYDHLPISPKVLDLATQSQKELLDRVKLIAPYLPEVRKERG